jgi:hypothetical protein
MRVAQLVFALAKQTPSHETFSFLRAFNAKHDAHSDALREMGAAGKKPKRIEPYGCANVLMEMLH